MILAADFHQLALLLLPTFNTRARIPALAQRTPRLLGQHEAVLAAHPAGEVQAVHGCPQGLAIGRLVGRGPRLGDLCAEVVHAPAIAAVALGGHVVAVAVAHGGGQGEQHAVPRALHAFREVAEVFAHWKKKFSVLKEMTKSDMYHPLQFVEEKEKILQRVLGNDYK